MYEFAGLSIHNAEGENQRRRAGLEGFTFHDLRRCYLNRLRQKGVSIETAMQLTGHKSLQTVLQHYREVPYSDLEEAVAALGGEKPKTIATSLDKGV